MGRTARPTRLSIAGGLAAVLILAACTPPPVITPIAPSAKSAAPEIVVTALPSLMMPKSGTYVPNLAPPEPVQLAGLDSMGLQSAIGLPSQRRREGKAEVWQYQGETCVMDVFLYPSKAAQGGLRVTYVELRRQGIAQLKRPDERRLCYNEALAEGRRNATTTKKP